MSKIKLLPSFESWKFLFDCSWNNTQNSSVNEKYVFRHVNHLLDGSTNVLKKYHTETIVTLFRDHQSGELAS